MEHSLLLDGRKIASFQKGSTLNDIATLFNQNNELKSTDFYLICNGKILKILNQTIENNVHVVIRCYGGKGGFGSMLRAIGAQIEKTTNREACRDLSGRRLRDINEEKRLKAWLEKQKDQKENAEEKKRKKLEKLLAVPKHTFKDAEYDSARSDMTEKVSEAVEEGFRKASTRSDVATVSGVKRKADDKSNVKKKKPALWIDDELGSSTETDSSDDNENAEIKSESQSCDKSNNELEKDEIQSDKKKSDDENERVDVLISKSVISGEEFSSVN